VPKPLREVTDSLSGTSVGINQLLDRDDTPLRLRPIQHCREDFIHSTGNMQNNHCLAGVKGLIHQLLGMLGIAEGRIEYDVRVFGAAGDRQGGALSRGISAGCEDHTIPAFRRCFSERPPE
jgi:hypothetical protein